MSFTKISTISVSRAEMKITTLIFITFSLVTAHITKDGFKILPTRKAAHRGLNQFVSSEDARIVGGNEAVPNSLPYQAALRIFYDEWTGLCGGSLITKRYVLTAAHCLDDRQLLLEVVLGAHKYREIELTQQRINTSTFKFHEQFNNDSLDNDLGVVYLPTPAKINQYVQLIALPSRADVSNNLVGREAITSGWGDDNDPATDGKEVLRYINVRIIKNEVCNETFQDLPDSVICTAGTGKKGVCFGDSGGPLVANRKLVGVTSFKGYNDCDAGDPSGFSRVTSFLDWIEANTDAVIA
ncbi:brachyurin-like [Agrilus planipennis]|uniref:Brachyurin-like n=1 Tax=Agrilus planipennis TaxID=224129 RepID=A0A7F5RJI4_AGRPL|nr:brachyurin-like [Agrilus planipennis]XP_025836159.1 brachyurin-like [Agrilus planipennis]